MSAATAETVVRFWRASNQSRSWIPSGNWSLRPLVSPPAGGRLRRVRVVRGSGAPALPCPSAWSASSGPSDDSGASIGSSGVVGRNRPAGSDPSPVLRSLAIGDDLLNEFSVCLRPGGPGRVFED